MINKLIEYEIKEEEFEGRESAFRFDLQYAATIILLIENEKFDIFFLPVTNLICQYIENQLKNYIMNYYDEEWTIEGMGIITHDLNELMEDEFFNRKNLKNTKIFKHNYCRLKTLINYFSTLLGKNTFLNSRYPVAKNKTNASVKKVKINISIYKRNFYELKERLHLMICFYEAERIDNIISLRMRFENKLYEELLKEELNKMQYEDTCLQVIKTTCLELENIRINKS